MEEFSDLSTQALGVPSFDEEIETLENQATADVSDLQIVSSKVVVPRIFYGGEMVMEAKAIEAVALDWEAAETDDWTQWFSNVEEVYVIHPDEDHLAGLPGYWIPGHAHLVKGSTTEELVM